MTMKLYWVVFILPLVLVLAEESEELIEDILQKLDPLDSYRKSFEKKRESQIEAMKGLKNAGNYEKQYRLIKQTCEMLFKVVADARLKLQEEQFLPGVAFPDDRSILDAYATILENVAFFGEFLLRQPDITQDILKSNKEWDLIIKWGVGFCEESNVFEGPHAKLLHLMSMELGIIPKEDNYVNPYSKEEEVKDEPEESASDKSSSDKEEEVDGEAKSTKR